MVKPKTIKRIGIPVRPPKTNYVGLSEGPVGGVSGNFNVQKDLVKTNVLITDKLISPQKWGLPATGSPGQIIFNAADKTFYGWNGREWDSFAGGGGGTFERVSLPGETELDPNVTKSLIEGSPGFDSNAVAAWATKVAGTGNENFDYYQELIAINDSDQVVTSVVYDSDPLNVYNANGSFAFSLPVISGGANNTALIRWSLDGEAHCIGRLASDNNASGAAIDINDTNDIVVSGYYYSATLLVYNGDQSFSFELSNEGQDDTFLIKYDINGNAIWGTKISGVYTENGYGNAINNNGDIGIATSFDSPEAGIYNSDGSVTITVALQGSQDALVVKYNSNGFADWVAKSDSDGYVNYYTLDLSNSGELIVAGSVYVASIVNIYNKSGVVALTFSTSTVSDTNSLLIKYTSIGELDWAVLLQSNNDNEIWGVSTNSLGNIYVSGYIVEDISIYNGNGSFATTLTAIYSGSYNDYVIKYSSTGQYIWSAIIASPIDLFWQDVCATDDSDNVYIVDSSQYTTIVEFYNQDRTLALTLACNDSAAFLVKYDPTGNVCWRTKVDNLDVSGDDYGYSVACNNAGKVVITGSYASAPVNVYNSDDSVAATLENEGNSDAFIVKYTQTGEVTLGNPTMDGQRKVITTNGPTIQITTTASSIEAVNRGILLQQYQAVEMLWDATESNWIVLSNEGSLF